MDYKFKHLSGNDVALFKQLLQVFGAAFNETDTYQGHVPGDQYLQNLLSKKDFIALVGLADGQVISGLTAYVLKKFEQPRSEVYIYDLAVLEKHRRKGLATGLIKELKNIARKLKAHVIYVQADKQDEPAIKLYQSLGTKEAVYHFDIPLND